MKKSCLKYVKILITFAGCSALLLSCSKQPILDAPYPPSVVYLNEAALTTVPSGSGIYTIASRIEGRVNTYKIDSGGTTVNIPLGVTRSGISQDGGIDVSITANTDTVAKMIAANKLPSGTVLLPSSAYAFPTTVNVPSGSSSGSFTLPVNLNFLLSNLTTKYAIGVTIAPPTGKNVNTSLSTVVIYIDPTLIIVPVANFTTNVFASTKTMNFVNLSANSVSYSWNFGDGSPISSTVSPSHVYTSGTYLVTLTATGITGSGTPAIKTTSITIL